MTEMRLQKNATEESTNIEGFRFTKNQITEVPAETAKKLAEKHPRLLDIVDRKERKEMDTENLKAEAKPKGMTLGSSKALAKK